jgi:L-ascorbate metabolism protein UlaG (beta-lactamase superfamily)
MTTEESQVIPMLHWLGHDSFRIDSSLTIYIDPWYLPPNSPTADLILVSHEHYDHCSPDDVERIRTTDTLLVANSSAAPNLQMPVRILNPGESLEHQGLRISGLPAYNLDKPFHPKGAGHLGFMIQIEGEQLYFAGDTDLIPEMDGIQCDVALLPVSGTYVMTAEEAVEAVKVIQTKTAIPMHYGAGVVGTLADAERFRDLSSVPVLILENEGLGPEERE